MSGEAEAALAGRPRRAWNSCANREPPWFSVMPMPMRAADFSRTRPEAFVVFAARKSSAAIPPPPTGQGASLGTEP